MKKYSIQKNGNGFILIYGNKHAGPFRDENQAKEAAVKIGLERIIKTKPVKDVKTKEVIDESK